MKLYFSHPIYLIILRSIYKTKKLNAVFVELDLYNRGQFLTTKRRNVINYRFNMSKDIAHILNIQLERITWDEFIFKKGAKFIESGLINKFTDSKDTLILQGGDAYTVFGFKNYLPHIKTKIRLLYYWRQKINLQNQKAIYIFNQNNIAHKINVHKIDNHKTQKLLNQCSVKLLPKLCKQYNLNLKNNEQYTLILPPISNYFGIDYTKRFLEKVFATNNTPHMKFIIKPHRNDELNYRSIVKNSNLVEYNLNKIKYLEVEFLFSLKNIISIFATPSSSLAFADKSKLTVYSPKNKYLRKQFHLDQENFLNHIGITCVRI
jgi:hypothetical protein